MKLSFCFFLILGCSLGLSQSSRQTKRDSILFRVVIDDTTRALAQLFYDKGLSIKRQQRSLTGTSLVSAALFGVGGITVTSEKPVLDVLGVIPLSAGAIGLIVATGMGVQCWIVSCRYSLKKYDLLIANYKSGQSLPYYYKRRIQRYLSGNMPKRKKGTTRFLWWFL